MKKLNLVFTRLLVFNLMLFSLFASAQTPKQLQEITATYDKAYLQDLAKQSLYRSKTDKAQAIQYANARNIPITYTSNDGGYAELQKVMPDGTLIYFQTNNADAAKSTRVNHINTGGSTGFNLDGQNMTSYVWDGGHARESHQEYDGPGGNNRVTNMDIADEGGLNLNFHAAHVVGTIGASGYQPQSKGMAPHSKVKAYKWNNDLAEATAAAANGMLISNHSYGLGSENLPAQMFGSYGYYAREWDNLMYNAPYYLMVKAAGNDGEDTHYNTQPILAGYDILSGIATAKNNLVVAAANDANVDNNGNLISVTIAGFSSPGPTDDYRIKPDIAGNGVSVYSTYESADNAYASIQGTSMASPNITGSLLLLQQHYNNVNSTYMRAATLKGLALHTADDAGPVGPDAKFGWGLLNAKRAAESITANGSASLINELVLTQGQTITLQVDSDGFSDLVASISWTDRPGTVNNGTNSMTPALVNDLDIRVSKNGTTYYPWRLTSATTNNKNGDNKVDPFERIDVANASGTYTITISHKGTLAGGSQAFSLIVTGLQVDCLAATIPQGISINDISNDKAMVSWNLIPGATYDLRYRKTGTSNWTTISSIPTTSYEINGLNSFTDYEVEVRSKCAAGSPSAYSTGVNFTTLGLDYCESRSNNPNSLHISNVTLNTINNNSTGTTYSDFSNISTDLNAAQTYSISITTTSTGNYLNSYAAWIDYNNNGVFDSNERIFSLSTSTYNPIATGTFTVPSTVNPLSTTMRVSMSYDSTIPEPCGIFSHGEVEDYAINLKTVVCAATTPTNITAVDISGSTALISWSTVLGASYDLRYREVGTSTWATILDISANNYEITGLNTYTEYETEVRGKCLGGSVSTYSNALIFTTIGLSYCESRSFDTSYMHISNVKLNTINNNSGASFYSDFTNIFTDLAVGAEYTIALTTTATSNWPVSYGVWIDYNNNGVFDEPTERIFQVTENANVVATGLFAIPADVDLNRTTMRVSMIYNTTVPGPCGEFGVGEVEDYTIQFIASPACPAPTGLTLTDVTGTTATLGWTAGSTESGWIVSWGNSGYTPGVNDLGTAVTTSESYQITGLNATGHYQFYIQANCDPDMSLFAGPFNFQTILQNDNLCGALPLNIGATSAGNAFTNVGATVQANEPLGACWEGIEFPSTVWFSFVAPPSGNITATTDILGATLIDTHIAIYEVPTNCADLTTLGLQVGCDEDSGDIVGYGWNSIITLTDLIPGDTYYIQVDGYSNSVGTFGLEVHDDGFDSFIYENGVWTPSDPNNNATASDNILVINGETSLTSDIEVHDVTVLSGATLNIEGVLSVKGDLTNTGNLVFVSSATRNGELATLDASSTITGNATVQRYMKNKRSYRMMSSAVTTSTSIHDNWQEGAASNTNDPNPGFGTHITGSTTDQFNGFDGTVTGNASMFTVNVATQQFEALSNTNVNKLTAGKPYLMFVRGDRNIDLTDNTASSQTILQATGSLLKGTNTQNFPSASAGNFVMFGNPYQSTVNINSVFANSSNLNTAHYYVYDPSLGDHGSYVTVVLPAGSNTSGSAASNFLQPGQGAQVAILAGGTSEVVFNEIDKAPGSFTSTNRPVSENDMLTVRLYTTENFNNGGSVHDSFGILFAEGANNALTSVDAVKPMNFYENLGVDHTGTYLSIEQREMPNAEEVFQLYSTGYQQADYTLKLSVDGLQETSLYLEDYFTGISTPLNSGDNIYSFSVNGDDALSIATDRFAIRTAQRLGVDDNNLLAGIQLFPNPLKADTFYIHAPRLNGEELMVRINDLSGRIIFEQALECRNNTVTVPMANNIASGIYLVILKHGSESNTYRLIKE